MADEDEIDVTTFNENEPVVFQYDELEDDAFRLKYTKEMDDMIKSASFEFSNDEEHLFVAEVDPFAIHVKNENHEFPDHYRVKIPANVTLSKHDRAHQMNLNDDQLTIIGNGPYCSARATHSVMYGKWYFEVEFLHQPPESHIRIGWGQQYSFLQNCVGYNRFGYGWRSLDGTIFHHGHGKPYFPEGYGEGDTLGCLIELPNREDFTDPLKAAKLPPSRKEDCYLQKKNGIFYLKDKTVMKGKENHDGDLESIPGSKITFFKNGLSCGVAYEDIFDGAYFPIVSIFHNASIKCNFGPEFKYPSPLGVRSMCERANEMEIEMALSEMLSLTTLALALDDPMVVYESQPKELALSVLRPPPIVKPEPPSELDYVPLELKIIVDHEMPEENVNRSRSRKRRHRSRV